MALQNQNLRPITSTARVAVIALGALALLASNAAAQHTVNLIAAPFTKAVTLPNGSAVNVPMWGFALDGDVNGNGLQDVGEAPPNGILDGAEAPTVPGPRLTVPSGATVLTINLTNLLSEPVSIVIPGQQATLAAPVRRADGRIVSMQPEAAPGGANSYTFTNLKPGTYVYHSGSHAAVQVQMGLYGAVTRDASAGEAYAGIPYTQEVVLLYSEIDVALHDAVASGTYNAAGGPTSTLDYAPSLFLVNGTSYTQGLAPIPVGVSGQRTLVRMLNAGLRSHVVVVDNASVALVAEDGNPYRDARTQASVLLPASKTHDAIWMPTAAGDYAVYDRTFHLLAQEQPSAGMMATLRVGDAAGGGPAVVEAVADSYALAEDPPAPVGFGSVLANDTGAGLTAELYALPSGGTLALNPDGTFSYLPQPNFSGYDAFWYRAVSGTGRSAPAPVTLTVAPIQDAPSAFPLTLGVNAGEARPITLSGHDPDGDPLTFHVTQLPADGTLSIIDPVTSGRRNLAAADLNVTGIPAGTVFYTATAAFVGETAFHFQAADGAAVSAPAPVSITVRALETVADTGTPITLTVVGSGGAAIGGYRWTLEEDRTYDPRPGEVDPNTLSVNFHISHMPVVSAGDETTQPKVDPTKKYFVSVLPKDGTHTNGGAQIARGQISVSVTVNATPMPTGQLRVQVFLDNGSLNGVYNNVEPGLEGFTVMIEDTGHVAQRGHQAAQQITDAFSNPIGTTYKACTDPSGCTSYEVDQLGKGFLLTDATGFATFKNLSPGLYEAYVVPPAGSNYVQGIQTLEGGKPIEAWVKPNEPPYFHEFGPPGPHVAIGFVQPTHDTTFLGAGAGPFTTITGRVTNLHMSRPPAFPLFSGAPFDFTRPYVALQAGAGEYGQVVYLQPTDEEGNFTIEGVPSGKYKLHFFDSATNFIAGVKGITVTAPAPMALGNVPIFQWFARSYQYVFEDLNQNGFREPGERGIPEQATNLRFRDGTIYKSFPTDVNGFVPYEEIFPWFNWLIAEVDYTRFKATGATVVVDAGGDTSANTTWPEQVGAEMDSRVLAPQPQSENGGAPFRTETGPVLLEAWQGFLGQSHVILWGKAPYAVPGSVPSDVNVVPFDDFPGPGDTDGNTNDKFDVDVYNGGITGIVHYSSTRAENLARWGTPEFFEPGIPRVRVQLWDVTRTRLLNEGTTDSWDDNTPTGCQGDVFMYLGRATDCYDGFRNFNQVRPGVFDGGYAFYTQKEPLVDATGNIVPIDQRTTERPLPAGKYVVKVIVPPGYKLVKEEDKNVDFGEEYIPAQFLLTGYPLADAGPPDPAARPLADNDNLITPFCVGALHTVPAELSLFPGIPGTYAGDEIPLCDEKLIVLRNGQNGTGNFFLYTDAPVAGKVVGLILDDTSNEFDPNAPQFGERYAPPWLPVSIRDWTGREIVRTYSDRNGYYNAMVPSTFTADRPAPDGYAQNMLQVCINSELKPGPGGTMVPDPLHNKRYSVWCFPFQYMPGATTYMDTPVVPTGAFAGQPGLTTLDAELPNLTPVVYSVNGPDNIGPYVVAAAAVGTRTITISSVGMVQVPNPEFDWVTPGIPKEVTRDYGFGALAGQVLLDAGTSTVTLPVQSWSNTTIIATVPVGTRTGQLRVIRCLASPCTATANQRQSVAAATLTVATPTSHAARPPRTVAAGGSIQAAIDAASAGDLILVPPGSYPELVIMDKPVRLQGWGALSTVISAVKSPTEKLELWRDRVKAMIFANQPIPLDPDGLNVITDPNADLDVLGPSVGSYILAYQMDEMIASLLPDRRPDGAPDPNEIPKLGDALGDLPDEILAILLGGEGGGVSVFGKYRPVAGVACPVTARSDGGYGLQNENGRLRPNARVDGFTITGSDGAAGIEVNANACDIEIANNNITNNNGYDGAGIKIGHIGVLASQGDDQANNDRVAISHNIISQNGSVLAHPGRDYLGGGGIAIGTGAPGYKVTHNFVAGNFTGGNGAGIAHIGLSSGGLIDHNTVVFNESFNQWTTRAGGGIFVGGRPPAGGESLPQQIGDPFGRYIYPPNLPGPTPGSGHVTVSNNLVQGNSAASGDGGGISLSYVNGRDLAPGTIPLISGGIEVDDPFMVFVWTTTDAIIAAGSPPWEVNVLGNTIVNNIAGLAGGGIALQDATHVHIYNNTIAHNDSLAVAGEAFELRAGLTDPFVSTPQPAGIASRQHTLPIAGLVGAGQPNFSNAQIVNSIVFENRSFYFGPVAGGVQVPRDPTAPTYGLIARPTSPFWDLGVLAGGAGGSLVPTFSVLTTPTGLTNVGTAPPFVSTYYNTNRRHSFAFLEIKTGLETAPPFMAPAFDEGGNFIRPLFGPLTLNRPNGAKFGDYHVTTGVNGRHLYGAGGLYSTLADVPLSLTSDADGDLRIPRLTVTPHRGADQVGAAAPPPPPPPPPTDVAGLVAAFGFDEGTGTTVSDSSPSANHGSFSTTNGPTRTTDGRFGSALVFDGINDLVTIPDSDTLDSTRMTISAWVKPSTLSDWRNVITKERTGTGMAGFVYLLYAASGSGGPSAYIRQGGAVHNTTPAAALATGAWQHLAATYDGTRLRVYVNGVQVESFAVSGNLATSTRPVFIGGNEVYGDEFFSGVIDEVRIYNRALSAAEIQTVMGAPVVTGAPPTP